MTCVLCHSDTTWEFESPFFRCRTCDFIFKSPAVRLSPVEEKTRYEHHNNSLHDPGYLKFLQPAVAAVTERVPRHFEGLDYGCGPEPVLAQILGQQSYVMQIYDPYFFPQDLNSFPDFDFITCTEAAEHFFDPEAEFKRIFAKLKDDGILILMTELFQGNAALADWYYTKDPTHVGFFTEASLSWLAYTFKRPIEILSGRLAVFGEKVSQPETTNF